MSDLISSVSNLVREAAETCVMPVFGKREANPHEKSPGEWVTEADKACEAFLEPALRSLIAGSLVVGEEAASADPSVLDRLTDDGSVWLIDPLDGTANFASGISPFAIMVALVRNGDTVASWVLDPITNQLSVSERGSGSWINGERITVSEYSPELTLMNGTVLRRFLPQELAEHIDTVERRFANLSLGSKCAGFDYPAIANGSMDFALYWRTLPWDHAPGVLFLQEAGGHATRPDGSAYRVADHARSGLLVARNKETWTTVKSTLLI
ncbi:MAG: inositol monophosphatase [Candidatus Nanopelagicaceae bacterium]|nr:inositol monophosphatase [Candidatus Nanopelagicaceae bacterium]